MELPTLQEVVAWAEAHQAELWWVTASSAGLFVATVVALPWVVCYIPADYFATKERPRIRDRSEHPVLRWTLRILRHLLGLILLLLGLVMLIGPGPGWMAVLASLLLMEFPGKRRMEMWVIRRPGLLWVINSGRAWRGRPPLVVWSKPRRGLPAPAAPAVTPPNDDSRVFRERQAAS